MAHVCASVPGMRPHCTTATCNITHTHTHAHTHTHTTPRKHQCSQNMHGFNIRRHIRIFVCPIDAKTVITTVLNLYQRAMDLHIHKRESNKSDLLGCVSAISQTDAQKTHRQNFILSTLSCRDKQPNETTSYLATS